MPFRILRERPVPEERLKAFWRDYDAGKRRSTTRSRSNDPRELPKAWFDQTGERKHEPMAVSLAPPLPGRVRGFYSQSHLAAYLAAAEFCNDVGKTGDLKFAVLQPTHILGVDRPNFRLVERVFHAPTVDNVLSNAGGSLSGVSLYGKPFEDKMKLKGFDLSGRKNFEKLRSDVRRAYSELREALVGTFVIKHKGDPTVFDFKEHNFLVLDYAPETGKVLLAVVDYLSDTAFLGLNPF